MLLPQTSSDSVDVTFKVSAVNKLCKNKLLKGWHCAWIEAELFIKFAHKAFGQNHISNAERGRDSLGKGVHIDYVVIVGKWKQCILRLWGNRELRLEIIFNNDATVFARPTDILVAFVSGRGNSCRKASVRCCMNDICFGFCKSQTINTVVR